MMRWLLAIAAFIGCFMIADDLWSLTSLLMVSILVMIIAIVFLYAFDSDRSPTRVNEDHASKLYLVHQTVTRRPRRKQ